MKKIKTMKVIYKLEGGGNSEKYDKTIEDFLKLKFDMVFDGSGYRFKTEERDLTFHLKKRRPSN
jgi:hypothetical protein